MTHVTAHNPRELPRVLRLFDISVLSSASMGPAYSIAATMGPMVVAAGTGAPLALLALAAIMLCMAVAFAQLSRVSPNAGSSYTWIREAFGARVGAYGAWLLLLSNFFATMSIALPAGIYTLELLAPAHADDLRWQALVGAVWIVGSSILLYVGIRPTAMVTAVALGVELLVMAASAVAAWIVHPAHLAVANGPHLPAAVIPLSLFGFVNAMTLGIWMTDGWEVSASTGEEIAGDTRSIGRGGITGLLLTTAFLMLAMISYLHLGTPAGFAANQDDVLAYVGDLLGGGAWRWAIVVTVLVSTCSTLWTTILYLSRSVYAMGRDGVLPRALGRLDERSEPLISLVTIAVLATVCQVGIGLFKAANDQLTLVVNISSVFLGLLFVFSAAACMRRFWGSGENAVASVWVPAAGALALLAVLTGTVAFEDLVPKVYALGGIFLGIPFALWRARHMAPSNQEG
ncbi:MAG: APC family permease [Candidatus Eremiobacteraeota bacterium]|nr:APC family permease [Candidatus Eremiobacteraeota bacterium]